MSHTSQPQKLTDLPVGPVGPVDPGWGTPPRRDGGTLLRGLLLVSAVAVPLVATMVLGAEVGLNLLVLAALALLGTALVVRLGPHPVLLALLVAGYLSGYVKLRYGSMLGYVVPEALCLLLVGYVLFGRAGRSLPLPRNLLTSGVLALTVYCLLQLANPDAPLLRSLAGLRSWILYVWLMFAGYDLLRSPKQLRQVLYLMLFLSIATALYGLWQWKVGPAGIQGHNAAMDEYAGGMRYEDGAGNRVFRAFSTFSLPSMFGSNMMVGLVLALVLLTTEREPRWIKGVALAGSPLMLGGLLASGSRGSLVILLLAVGILLWLRRLRSVVPVVAVILAGGYAGIALTTQSAIDRFSTAFDPWYAMEKWMIPFGVGIRTAWNYPLGKGLGYTAGVPSLAGFRGVTTQFESMNVDSGIGAAAAELGWAGLAVFLFFLFALAAAPLRGWRALPPGRTKDLLVLPVVLAVTFVLTSVIAVPHASLPWSIYFWALLGMLFKAPFLPPDEDGAAPIPVEESVPPIATPLTRGVTVGGRSVPPSELRESAGADP